MKIYHAALALVWVIIWHGLVTIGNGEKVWWYNLIVFLAAVFCGWQLMKNLRTLRDLAVKERDETLGG